MLVLVLLCLAGFLLSVPGSRASFLYGEPCTVRNTAYLYSTKWVFPPDDHPTDCVDITSYKKPILKDYKEFFRKVSKANTLYADHMNLTRFPLVIVHSLPQLNLIDVSGNEIKKLPRKLYKFAPKIEKLLVSKNSVNIAKRKPLMYSGSLKTLMLSSNNIDHLNKATFSKLPALEVLYLDRNNLKVILPDYFKVAPNLKYLHVGQNEIEKVPPRKLMPASLVHYIVKDQRKKSRAENRSSSRD